MYVYIYVGGTYAEMDIYGWWQAVLVEEWPVSMRAKARRRETDLFGVAVHVQTKTVEYAIIRTPSITTPTLLESRIVYTTYKNRMSTKWLIWHCLAWTRKFKIKFWAIFVLEWPRHTMSWDTLSKYTKGTRHCKSTYFVLLGLHLSFKLTSGLSPACQCMGLTPGQVCYDFSYSGGIRV